MSGIARRGFFLVLAALLAVAVVLAGCHPASAPPSGPPGSGGTGGRTSVAPRYALGSGDTATVVGYVGRSALEGGFWAAYATLPTGSDTRSPQVLAVLLPGNVGRNAIAALEGAYVRATGRVAAGASTRMAGPEVLVDSIEALPTR